MRIFKKFVSVLLMLAMVITNFTIIPIQASEETGQGVYYKYRFWDSNQVRESILFQENVQKLSSCQNTHSLSGWYYLDKNFEVSDRVTVSDEAHIILTEGYTATFKRGIRVASGKELNLYPNEKNDNGRLIANGYNYGAAIGSNDEDDGAEDSAGTINIYGGNITANGVSDAAGIGGGNEASGGTVRIYGGFVTAKGGEYAAGIGGGDECGGGDIYIYGGKVKADGGQDGAGIGGGEDGSSGTYTQYGGSVTATGGMGPGIAMGGGAGIGGGEDGNQGTVNIYGGVLNAHGGSFSDAAGIGGGGNTGISGDVNISGGSVCAGGSYGAGIGGCSEQKNGTIRITGGEVVARSTHAAGIGSGYGEFNDQGGDILIENASVESIGKGYGAGIGGGSDDNKGGSGKNVTIRKSVVVAGSSYGAGIGGGGPHYGNDGGHGGFITIEESMVFAISKERGAGIGGGNGGDGGGTTIIRDSFVEAYGGSSSYNYMKETVSAQGNYTILKPTGVLSSFAGKYDAKVADVIVALILNDEWGGAGIGGGSGGRGANVQIEGDSTVIAVGGREGTVAIGHGYEHTENRTLTLDSHLSVVAGADADHAEKALKANLATACQNNRYAVIQPCEHESASYTGEPAGHIVSSCPYCSITFEEGTLEPHIFGANKKCTVCDYQGVEIQFDSGGMNATMDPVIIGRGYQYTIPVNCPLSTVRQGDNTYLLRYWKSGDDVYLPGETINNVDSDMTLVAFYATGGVNIIRSENGHVDANILAAQPGETVTLTAVPDEDCRLTKIRVVGGAETVYEMTAQPGESLGLTHSFTMPAGSAGVTVTSVFEKNQHEIQIDAASFAAFGAGVPEVLVNGLSVQSAYLNDEITVTLSPAGTVETVVYDLLDGDGNVIPSYSLNELCTRSFGVGADGKITFTMTAANDIRIRADNDNDHMHDGILFEPWSESTRLPSISGNYYLTTDIVLDEPYRPYSGNSGVNIKICLNGHTISCDREMDYMLIPFYSNIAIYDDDDTGKIDGGGQATLFALWETNLTLYGGTLMNGRGEKAAGVMIDDIDSRFTMHGGVITGMHNNPDSNYNYGYNGAGVLVEEGCFAMDGGAITGNDDGIGVNVGANGTFEISGSPVISDNGNRTHYASDVFLRIGSVIHITGKLSGNARIGIGFGQATAPKSPLLATAGLPENGTLDNFISTDPDFTLGLINGEAALAGKRTVTFDMNGGSPAREPETAALGCDYVLPENTATRPEYVFSGWKIGDTDTVLPAGETTYISENVTLHAVWEKANEYAYYEHVYNWEIKNDENDTSKVTVRCVEDGCNETDLKYAQLRINGETGIYNTNYNGSGVTATVYKQQTFYGESLIHVSEVTYVDILGNESNEPPVDAGVYFAQATISPAVGKGDAATISQMIIINRTQPNITVTGCELTYTGQPQKLVNETDIGEGSFIYRINGGEWTMEPYASGFGDYQIEWYYEGENYANVHSPEVPGVVNTSITDIHIADEPVHENEVSASCTEEGGYDLVTYCTTCGAEMAREHITLEKLPHTEQIISGTPAGCDHTGLTDGKRCSVCGAILVEQQVIPVTHAYGDAVWTWTNDHSSATASFTCSLCGHEESLEADVTSEYADGTTTYTATVIISGQTYTNSVSVDSKPTYSYIDANGEEQYEAAEPLTESTLTLESGWYAVDTDLTISERISYKGDVHLILCDGVTLHAPKGIGINESEKGSITIYAQSGGSGTLIIDQTGTGAGIGGNDDMCSVNVTINGGNITACGSYYCAGIGGSRYGSGTITINGGVINAEGGQYAAAIGGGAYAFGNVTINGGTVNATGRYNGIGIGSGYEVEYEKTVVTINGGTVDAIGYDNMCGIGGSCRKGPNSGSVEVTINGGIVSATVRTGGSGAGIGIPDSFSASITLSWSAASDRITADNYKGTVTLLKSFTDGTSIFESGTVGVNDIKGKTLMPDIPASWAALQAFIDSSENGSTITLYQNYEATAGDTALIIPDKTLTIDLNGFTLDRNLTEPAENGNVITNNGNLTIMDSGKAQTGTITGGKNSSAGGAVLNNGTLTIEGGVFSGNKAQEGGAIANKTGATLTINGGSVTGNTTTQWGGAGVLNQGVMTMNGGTIAENSITETGMNGAGIWTSGVLTVNGGTITSNSSRTGNGGGIYYTGGTLNLSGSPVITGNTASGGDNDLFINGDRTLTIVDELTENARIGIRGIAVGNVFTSGLSGNGIASGFISNDSRYEVHQNDNGEAYLSLPYVAGHSLSLSGDIGLNFYMNLSDQEIAAGAKVDFVWTVDGNQKTHTVTLTDANKTSDGYKASCPIAVAEMTYDVIATLTIGEKVVKTDTYSAVTYANVILTNQNFRTNFIAAKSETKYNQLVTLVKTMLDYGSKAQVRFDRDTDHLANGGTDYFNDEVTIPRNASNMDEYLEDCGLEYVGTSVIYLSETTLRHYYRIVDSSKFTNEIKNGITFDGESVAYGEKSGRIYFDKKNIIASQLDTEYVLTINGHEYHYSALDYSSLAYSSDNKSYDESIIKQLAAAAYRYNQAANAYFEN